MGQMLFSALVTMAFYSIIALGYVLIYRASKVLNLAHGDVMMVGTYFAFSLATFTGGQTVIAIMGSAVLAFVLGAAIYFLALRLVVGQPGYVGLILTIGLGFMFQGLASVIWTPFPRYLENVMRIPPDLYELPGSIVVSVSDIAMILTAIAFFLGVMAFLDRTRLGKRMRAAAEDPLLASFRGVNLTLVFALAWGVASFGATLAGTLYTTTHALTPTLGYQGFKAFSVSVVGGLTSMVGVVPGVFIVGAAETLASRYIGSIVSNVVPMLILLVVLIIRPWGLLGESEEIERV